MLADGEELVYAITVERLLDIRLRDGVSVEIDGIGGAELGVELADTATASLVDVEVEELQAEVHGTAVMRVSGATGFLEVGERIRCIRRRRPRPGNGRGGGACESARVVVNDATLLEADVRDSAVVEHVGTPAQTELESALRAGASGHGNADPRPNRPWFGDGDQSGYERGRDTRHQPID